MHQLGTAIQDLGPLDGSGLVLSGLAVHCGGCSGRFIVDLNQAVTELGSSIWNIKETAPLHCPYCGLKDDTQPGRSFMTDTRPMSGEF